MVLPYLLLPFMGAVIGYGTNVLAIKSLFRPHMPRRFLFWTVQGLLPRHREQLARNVARVLEETVLTPEEMDKHWRALGLEEEVEKAFRGYLEEKLRRHLRLLPGSIQDSLLVGLEKLLQKDIHKGLEEIRESLTEHLQTESQLGDLVAEKIQELNMQEVEDLIVTMIHKELRYVEAAGAVLGFVVGLLQMTFLMLWGTG